jgi:hypothetical protein
MLVTKKEPPKALPIQFGINLNIALPGALPAILQQIATTGAANLLGIAVE